MKTASQIWITILLILIHNYVYPITMVQSAVVIFLWDFLDVVFLSKTDAAGAQSKTDSP